MLLHPLAGVVLLVCGGWTDAANQFLSPCVFPKETRDNSDIERLVQIVNQTFNVTDEAENITDRYTYSVGICSNVGKVNDTAAVVQRHTDTGNFVAVIGRYNQSSIKSGSHWILLDFAGGDHYNNACNKTERMASVMLICNHDVGDLTRARVVEENSDLTSGCYYMFEVEHCLACEEGCDSYYKRLSPGSVILISVFSTVAVYLLFGFAYQRCIAKARGWDQIPNFRFWQEVGNLQADGCSYVCRCGSGRGSSDEYEPAGGIDSRHSAMAPDANEYRGSGGTSLMEEDEPDERLLAA